MTAVAGPIGSILQSKVDTHHAATLQKHSERISELNYQLRFILDDINTKCKKMQNDPDIKGPYDLREFEDRIMDLEELYKDYKQEYSKDFPNEGKALDGIEKTYPRLFPENLSKLSEADIKVVLDAIEQMQKSNKDEVQDITQNLYLVGQLFITITDIIRKMDETYRRFLERIAEKLGGR